MSNPGVWDRKLKMSHIGGGTKSGKVTDYQ